MQTTLRHRLLPFLFAGVAVSASLAQSLSRGFPPPADPGVPPLAASAFSVPSASIPGPTEGQLRKALPGKTLIRTDTREFQRWVAAHGTEGLLLTGPALAALAQGGSAEDAGRGEGIPSRLAGSSGGRSPADAHSGPSRICPQTDSLARRACLDSLSRARVAEAERRSGAADRRGGDSDRRGGDSDRRRGDSAAHREAAASRDSTAAPRALREIEQRRDTVYIGRDGEEVERPAPDDASSIEDEVRAERTRGYIGQLFLDLGKDGDDWDWGGGDWAVVIYVVVGVIVVGAFILGGAKALYDLVVNRQGAPVFKELGARFSYSGLTMYGNDGTTLYRDAWLYGLRFAIGVQRDILSLGLAAEGGSINLRVRGFPGESESVDFRGAYLVGGPMVRFGNYHPLAFTLEFLNGTSDHESIGWISKSRMTLAGKVGRNLVVGAHLGAVFYDLKFSDGLVFRRGDLNRDLSMMLGLDLGYAF